MMERRPIPFVDGEQFRIDREGCVYGRRERPRHGRRDSRSRSPGSISIAWEPRKPISLEAARQLGRSRGRDGGELVIRSREYPFKMPGGETLSMTKPASVRRVSYLPKPPVDAELLIGEVMQAHDDVDINWFCITSADGMVHLFHGPSVAREVFGKNAG